MRIVPKEGGVMTHPEPTDEEWEAQQTVAGINKALAREAARKEKAAQKAERKQQSAERKAAGLSTGSHVVPLAVVSTVAVLVGLIIFAVLWFLPTSHVVDVTYLLLHLAAALLIHFLLWRRRTQAGAAPPASASNAAQTHTGYVGDAHGWQEVQQHTQTPSRQHTQLQASAVAPDPHAPKPPKGGLQFRRTRARTPFQKPSRLRLVAIALCTTAPVFLVLALLTPVPWWGDMLITFVLSGVLFMYAKEAIDKREKFVPTDEQAAVMPDHSLVSERQLDRIRHKLLPGESQIQDIRHTSRVFLYRVTVPLGFLAGIAGMYTLAALAADGDREALSNWWQLPLRAVPWPFAWLAVAVLCMLAAWWQWVIWSSHFFIVTNFAVIEGRMPPWWLPFMDDPWNPIFFDTITDVRKKNASFMGKMFGYGPIEVATAADTHERFERISRADEVATLLLREQHKAIERRNVAAQFRGQPSVTQEPPRPPAYYQQAPDSYTPPTQDWSGSTQPMPRPPGGHS